jgi:hypothetical protein
MSLLVVVALVSSVACSKKDGAGGADAAASASASATPKAAAAPPRKPGAMPWADFVSGPLTAKKDDYVLVPSGNWIEDAFTKGTDKPTFIYYAAKITEVGPTESKVKNLAGTEFSAPNGFIIPIKVDQKVKPGDVVLTWWQSGSGMQRSIVTGGTDDKPKVFHLDLDLDNPSGVAKKEDTLEKSSFHKLGSALEPGVTIAVKDGKGYSHWIATGVSGDKVLAIGFAGRMNVFKKSDCTVVPAQGTFAVGKDVAVPSIGTFTKGKVDKVDAKIGRVYAKYTFGGAEKLVAFGLPNVSPLLPGL